MTEWLNFFTMDVIGDLPFGEPFGCLKTGEYHSWVRTLFSYLKGMSLAAAPRYYLSTEFLFQKLIPKSVREGQRRHTQYANEKINHRLDLKTNRPDIMTPFMKNNVNFENMPRDEILSTFNFIIAGGSDNTATILTGIFNHLSRNEGILQRLCTEIRTKFQEEKDITIDAIQGLPYLEAVLNEGLRFCNPIPGGLPRVVPEGGDTYAGVYLPGGVSYLVLAVTIIQAGSDNSSDEIRGPVLHRQSLE
jgi:cytochrome P450